MYGGRSTRKHLDAAAGRIGAIAEGGGQSHGGDRADGVQSLAPESQRVQTAEVVGGAKLGCGVRADSERGVARGHPRAVVADPDHRRPAAGDLDLDARGSGVQRVLYKLLDRRGGTLDHLSRRYPARHLL